MTELKGSSGYVSWHTHSDMSQLDGAATLEEYAKVAHGRGDPALGISDHGTMRGLVRQHEACAEVGIKPIFGTEFYVARDMKRRGLTDQEKAEVGKGKKVPEAKLAIKAYEEREGIRDRWHTTVWALNQTGLKNLFRLSSLAWLEGFYYKPRIDLARLMEYQEGLVVSTGCLSSPINDLLLQGKKRESRETFERLAEVFGERLVVEVQPHAIRDQRAVNENLLRLRGKVGSAGPRLLAAQDSHYIYKTDAPHHEVLLCIGTNDVMSTPPGDGPGKRFAFDGDEFHFRDRKEMIRAFARHHEFFHAPELKEALDSTVELAELCTAKLDIDYHKGLLPTPEIPPEYEGNTFKRLVDLCLDGWRWRRMDSQVVALARRKSISKREAGELYRARLKYELGVLKKKGFDKYFLVVWDIYRFARENGIMTGPGRGSVGGSLVAYLIGVTSVDPLEHELIFERFMNPDRVDMPDIDMDFEDRRRGEIVQYLKAKYGEDKVAQIATVGVLSGKQCLLSISRVLEIPLVEVTPVTKSIIERSSGDERKSQTIEDSFKEFDVCRKFNKKYPQVLIHAKRLEGLAKTLGIHAAGVVTSPIPLVDVVPLEVRTSGKEKKVVTAVDYEYCAALGLVKLDVLGLRTLSVIRDANDMIEKRHGKRIDFENLEEVRLDDKKVLEAFTRHDYVGIFQYDTPSADKVCQGVTFDRFDDVAAMVALNRPGTSRSGLATKFVQRKKNPELAERDDYHPKVTEITKDTLGIMVYQEHIVRIFTEIAGFAPGASDSLRKAIAKKFGDETIGKERDRFIEGAEKHSGIKKSIATKIFNDITFFGCLPAGTLVATPLGFRRIEEFQSGDPIWSYDYKAETPIANRVRRAWSSGLKDVYRIRYKRIGRGKAPPGEVRASEGHWWLMSDGSYQKTSELREGSIFCSPVSPAGYMVKSIELDGHEETFDLECAEGPANYILHAGLVCHNSYGFNKAHSVEYGMISYWQMWIKVHYPLEFYYGLLKNEPDRVKIQSIAKDAKNHGIELLAPHISTSAKEFTVDGDKIRGSLVDIKGVGDKAAASVMAGQPYKDFSDFARRIDRRRVNRGAVLALARAGAMEGIIPNLKFFSEHVEKLWEKSKNKPDAVQAILLSSKKVKDYDKDEAMIIASSANPLAFGKHPVEAYNKLLDSLPIKVIDSSADGFLERYDEKSVYVAGMLTEVRYNQIGDFHSGAEPSAEEKRVMFWGERYANVTVEDAGGKQHRCRFDVGVFETHRAVIDRGVGCPILLFATVSNFTSRLWARFVVPLDEARKLSKELEEAPLYKRLAAPLWWRVVAGHHPALHHTWKDSIRGERRTNARFWKERYRGAYCGLIVNIKKKYDRNGHLMAFIGIFGPEGRLIEVVIFARSWEQIQDEVQIGSLVVVEVKKDFDKKRGASYIFDDRLFRVVKKAC